MSAQALEAFLARLYVDAGLRERFLRDPEREASAGSLSPDERDALVRIDVEGLRLASASFEHKRASMKGKHLGGGTRKCSSDRERRGGAPGRVLVTILGTPIRSVRRFVRWLIG